VWIIFDELDQRLAFEQRPATVAMPEFDKLRGSALYATAAYSPTSGTLSALPSLITGKLVASARPVGPGDLRIMYADPGDTNEVRWSEEPNVFSRARALGIDSALIGWYHPYCRELTRDLTSCWWTAMPFQADSVGRTTTEAVPKYLRSLFETSLLSPFGQSLSTREAAERFQALFAEARRAVANPSFGLVFLHLQVPHAPHAYSRHNRDFTLSNAPVTGYLDSLALADIALGELRHAMEESSLWDSTTVLVSSDHSYRTAVSLFNHKIDRRVPFLLKMSGQNSGQVYTQKFNTVVSADLVLSILRNEVTSLEEATARVDRSSAQFAGIW
jgi:arylsulfatase A-like enzyme